MLKLRLLSVNILSKNATKNKMYYSGSEKEDLLLLLTDIMLKRPCNSRQPFNLVFQSRYRHERQEFTEATVIWISFFFATIYFSPQSDEFFWKSLYIFGSFLLELDLFIVDEMESSHKEMEVNVPIVCKHGISASSEFFQSFFHSLPLQMIKEWVFLN